QTAQKFFLNIRKEETEGTSSGEITKIEKCFRRARKEGKRERVPENNRGKRETIEKERV
ncbi:hypothetical protein TIFTF001_048258, partial [Ficus carica]